MENSVCLVVPCYNEAARLNIETFQRFARGNGKTRLLFVDDGSSDDTIKVLESIRAGNEASVAILACERNGGKAEAVRRGILHAIDSFHPHVVGFWDADLATPLDAVADFISVLERLPGIEMIFGARVKLLGRHVERRMIRHYPGRVFATVVSILLDISVYDTQCGAKLFRVRPDTRFLFVEPFLSKWVFDVEIIARYKSQRQLSAKQLEGIIYELPLEKWTDVAGSKLRLSDFFKAFWDVLRIYLRYLKP